MPEPAPGRSPGTGLRPAQPSGPLSASRRVTPAPVPTGGLSLPAAAALAIVVSAAGVAYDLATGTGLRRVFAACFVAGCVLAAGAVRRDRLRPVLPLPPLVYLLMAAAAAVGSGPAGSGPASRAVRAVAAELGIATFSTLALTAPALLAGTGLTVLIVLVRGAAGRR